MHSFTDNELQQLAEAIADPTLSLLDVPRWPQWFRELPEADRAHALKIITTTEQPKLDAALRELYRAQGKPLHCGTCGNDWADCICTLQDLDQ